ncbi:MAG: DoxX family protein [Acidobacteriota bacterium]
MERYLGRYSPYFYALLRFVAGLMFAMHGSQKLFGWPGDRPPVSLTSLMGVAGVVELAGGVLIAFGLLTGVAAFIASGQMAFAFFMSHWPKSPIPIMNGGELPVLYCFLFLYIASRGSGTWSLDGRRRTRK